MLKSVYLPRPACAARNRKLVEYLEPVKRCLVDDMSYTPARDWADRIWGRLPEDVPLQSQNSSHDNNAARDIQVLHLWPLTMRIVQPRREQTWATRLAWLVLWTS